MATQAENNVSAEQPDLDEVLEKINEIAKVSATGNYIYRGEPAHHAEKPYYGTVTSGLYRSFLERGQINVNVKDLQEKILEEARGYIPGKIDDSELLATLQHYGHKTMLIDFTTDYLVALFFACEREPEKPGRVILLPEVSEDENNGYKLEKPSTTIRRADIQKSIFVIADRNSVRPDKDKVVCIPADLKKSLLYHLRKHHNISAKTIYNDLHGFIEIQRLHEEAYTALRKGSTYQNLGDVTHTDTEKQKLYDEAIEHYGKAIQLKPDLIVAYNERGVAYHKKCVYDEAIKNFDEVIKWNPEDANAYNNRGNAYYGKRNFDLAIQDYTQAIAVNPKDTRAYNDRGNVYYRKGDFDLAIQDYTQAIAVNPEDARAYNNRGNAYYGKRNFDLAIQDYTQAIALNPEKNADFYNNRGNAYYRKVIKLISEDPDVFKNKDFYYNRTRECSAAILDYTTVIELNPQYANAYCNRGLAWLHMDGWQNAGADLITARNNMGFDIAASFHKDYESVADFEKKNGVRVPADIAALLQQK